MADKTVSVDIINITLPLGNHEMIPIINKPNPCYGYSINAEETKFLIQLPKYNIYEAGTKNLIDGTNYYDYFPDEGGGGGGGGDVSRYTVEKVVDPNTDEASFKLLQSLNGGESVAVGDVICIRGEQMLVQYGSSLSILDTALATIKEKIDATYNFTTFDELEITTSGKTLKEITDELYAKGLPTNTIVTGQLYSSALPFSGNGEAEVMINGPAFWWKCTSLNVAPYSWNAICGGGSWSGVIMDWTPTYITEQPMVFKGSATLTADSTDTTKCTITVSTPSTASRIKRGYMYKVTSIAVSPAYTGTIKVGDTLIADKDAPVIGPTWTVDTDWTVVPSGDEEGKIYYAAAGGGLQLSGADNNEFGHSNAAITPQTELGVYKVKHDALGHVIESEVTSTVSAVTGLVTAAPSETAPPNAITYTSYANERLKFHQIGFNVNNTVVSTVTPPPPAVVTREVDFVNNTKSITGNISDLQVYQNMGRCNVADDGTINAYYGEAGYTEDGSNGQVMVKVPKFYYKLDVSQTGDLDGVNIRKGRWSIADVKVDNTWKLHPAFLAADGVTELDYFMYGAFESVGQDSNGTYSTSYNTSTYKLGSVGGNAYTPTNNFTRATARTMATNRGTGWYSAGVKQTMAVLMLFAVEYGFNSQLAVGWGVVSDSAAHKTGETTGNTTSGTRDNKTTSVNYRGIENLWGNIWNWIDGLNCNERTPYVCDTFTFVDNTSTGYTQIAFNLPLANYITAFGYDANNDWVLLPSESSSTANVDGPIGDYVDTGSGWLVTNLGGRWPNDSIAGAFYWSCFSNSAGTTASHGARLMYIPQTV